MGLDLFAGPPQAQVSDANMRADSKLLLRHKMEELCFQV